MAPIFVLTGAPASGKSSVSASLLNQFAYGVHISVDKLRGMVVSGLSNPIGSWDDETDRQFRLARDSAAQVAKVYADDGMAVVIDDVIFPDAVAQHYDDVLSNNVVIRVLLRPDLAENIARNRRRTIDVENAAIERIIKPIYEHFASFGLDEMKEAGWLIIDTSQQSIEETVAAIMSEV